MTMNGEVRLAGAVLCLMLLPAACGTPVRGGPEPSASDQRPPTSASDQRPPMPLPTGGTPVTLDPSDFSVEITNPYWPMKPRTRWTYREVDPEGTVLTVTVVVTASSKRVANGITARVVRDTVRAGSEIVEDTFDWYAQDRDGNVWYLGEETAEFDKGKIVSRSGSFEAGVDGAQPGIAVPGRPKPGLAYRQEYYRGEAEDNGEVLSTTEMVQVPAGRYRGALLTKDTTTIEPDVQEYKLYAKGVGPVLTLDVSGGTGREELITMDTAGPTDGTGPLGHPNP